MPARAEIEEIRGMITAVDDDSGILKLLTIVTSTQKLKDGGPENELHAYYVAASIAAIESFVRWQIHRSVDLDKGQFLNNIRLDDRPIKLTHQALVILQPYIWIPVSTHSTSAPTT
jgi:hypothetical protein